MVQTAPNLIEKISTDQPFRGFRLRRIRRSARFISVVASRVRKRFSPTPRQRFYFEMNQPFDERGLIKKIHSHRISRGKSTLALSDERDVTLTLAARAACGITKEVADRGGVLGGVDLKIASILQEGW